MLFCFYNETINKRIIIALTNRYKSSSGCVYVNWISIPIK